jgi:hypothetical protein
MGYLHTKLLKTPEFGVMLDYLQLQRKTAWLSRFLGLAVRFLFTLFGL